MLVAEKPAPFYNLLYKTLWDRPSALSRSNSRLIMATGRVCERPYTVFEDCSVHYIRMDKIASLVKPCGSGCFMAKLDLEDAYKHIMVRCEDCELSGSVWDFKDENGHITNVYYVDLLLPFGLKSSAKLFNMFTDALEFL